MNIRIGHGYDAHCFAVGRKLILGGVEIPYSKGLLAHSDGDVIIHALCDALLGALALGDLGQHFPNEDDSYLNIDSRILLRKTIALVNAHNFILGNADITVLAQSPKLAPFIMPMRENMAKDLMADVAQVSIKATTTEKMGFIGREEGVAAYAVVLLRQQ